MGHELEVLTIIRISVTGCALNSELCFSFLLIILFPSVLQCVGHPLVCAPSQLEFRFISEKIASWLACQSAESLSERAACCGPLGSSFAFLLLSATLVFTLTHRNSSPVSMTFVSTLPSVDLRKHCTSSSVAV